MKIRIFLLLFTLCFIPKYYSQSKPTEPNLYFEFIKVNDTCKYVLISSGYTETFVNDSDGLDFTYPSNYQLMLTLPSENRIYRVELVSTKYTLTYPQHSKNKTNQKNRLYRIHDVFLIEYKDGDVLVTKE